MRRAMQQVATTGELARLQRLVTELGDTVAVHATAAASGPARGEPEQMPSWLCAPADSGNVRALLTDLTRWLDDIYLRYADAARTLPECWLWHPEVVEELTWLMYAWLAAYQADEASVKAAGTGTTGSGPAWSAGSVTTPRAARWTTTSQRARPHPHECRWRAQPRRSPPGGPTPPRAGIGP